MVRFFFAAAAAFLMFLCAVARCFAVVMALSVYFALLRVRTAFFAAWERLEAPRAFAAARAWRDSARCDAAERGWRFSAFFAARDRFVEGFLPPVPRAF